MFRSRYREERTLVRGLHRLPGEDRKEFKNKVLRLRKHFEQFNLDTAELCQWLMGLRPGGKKGSHSTEPFWEFFLEPKKFLREEDWDIGDMYRRMVFDVVGGFKEETSLSRLSIVHDNPKILNSVRAVRELELTATAERLFRRLSSMNPVHRQVLLKAAAEWVVARYQRGYENWERHNREWEKERNKWERNHPELTEQDRQEFNEIFKQLGIREKRPRVCTWDRLKESRDNCEYAGERIGGKNHSALCVKYKKFYDEKTKCGRKGKIFKDYFIENANCYLQIRNKEPHLPKDKAMDKFLRKCPQARWFPDTWDKYLEALGIKESTILSDYDGRIPHCERFDDALDCEFNRHTELCKSYLSRLDNRPRLQKLDALYREWRKKYLSGPSKPSFRYPSSEKLPMPKIFGAGFYRVDFKNSVLELRLDDMQEGEYLRFGFKPWPRDYRPQPQDTEITSVHINFIGVRARAGFRFRVEHKNSRFRVSQDDIDELRSQEYPRKAQDKEFLDEARKRLLDSFSGDTDKDLKILAVDLGETGACAALFKGKNFQEAIPLKIIKLDKLYEVLPKKQGKGKKKKERQRGLGKNHVGRHLDDYSEGAKKIAEKRKTKETGLGDHDLRRLTLHVRWMIRDWVRLNASQIIKTAEKEGVDLIVFESMRGFSAPGRDKLDADKKRRLAFFAHGRIRRKVAEKAVERGMRTVTVPYLKSSQLCAICGQEQQDKEKCRSNKKKKRTFKCERDNCRNECNSDENAARLLGRVFWGEIDLPVETTENT